MLTKQEIRQLGNKEMMDELQKSRRELLKYQFDIRSGSSKESHMVTNLKRYIAQLQTIAKEMKFETKSGMSKAEASAAQESEPKKAPAAKVKKAAAPKKAAPAKTAAAKSPKAKTAKK